MAEITRDEMERILEQPVCDWQVDVVNTILSGQRVVFMHSRGFGMTAVRRTLAAADAMFDNGDWVNYEPDLDKVVGDERVDEWLQALATPGKGPWA
jgi:hypothetical protein